MSSTSDYMSWKIALGIGLLLIGCTVDNIGITMQKISHRHQKQTALKNAFYCSDWRWTSGIVLYLSGNIINAVALPFVPQSLYAALGSTTLVINVLTSRLILKETLNKLIAVGTFVIILGSIAAVLSGDHSSDTYSLEYIQTQSLKPLFLVYFIVLVACIVLISLAIHGLAKLDPEHQIVVTIESYTENSRSISPITEGTIKSEHREVGVREIMLERPQEAGAENNYVLTFLNKIGLNWHHQLWRSRVLSVMYPLLAGMIGSITMLSAKAAAEMVASASQGNPEFSKFTSYMFFVVVFVLGGTQIHVLNLGLRKFDQIVVIPVFTVSLESFSVLISIIFFEEYRSFNVYQSIFFPLSIFVTYVGVYITAVGQKTRVDQNLVPSEGFVIDSEFLDQTDGLENVPAVKGEGIAIPLHTKLEADQLIMV